MKIVVLGGAGDVGSCAVEDLAKSPGVTAVTIADQNVQAARELAARLEGHGATLHIAAVDANVKDSLVGVMRGHDVAASALGPFHRFETKLVSAALEAEIDYASVCDEWEPAQKVFEKFSTEAAEQDRRILIGLGVSPGVTSLAVAHMAHSMDRLTRVAIYCYQPLLAGGGRAVLQHLFHLLGSKTMVWRQSKRIRIAPLSEEATVELPGVGAIRVWNAGHAEPVTLPLAFPELESATVMLGFGRGAGILTQPARWGLFGTRGRIDVAVEILCWLESWFDTDPRPGSVRIEVEGTRGGQPVSHALFGVGQLRAAAGVSLSIGAQMLARRELLATAGGVYAPEALLPAATVLRAMVERGLHLYEDLQLTQPLQLER